MTVEQALAWLSTYERDAPVLVEWAGEIFFCVAGKEADLCLIENLVMHTSPILVAADAPEENVNHNP